MMHEFLQMASERIGIREDTARSASSRILEVLREYGEDGDVEALLAKLPDVESLWGAESNGHSAGLLGLLAGGGGSRLGANLGALAGAVTSPRHSGISGAQLGSLVKLFVGYAREHAGDELVDRLLDQAPVLKTLVR